MFKIAAAILVTAFAGVGAAEAHPKLLSATPAASSEGASPSRIELHFSEKLVPAFSGMDVQMMSIPGMKMKAPMKMPVKTSVGPDGMALIGEPEKPLSAGSYRVNWHVVSTDTHRVEASYMFAVR